MTLSKSQAGEDLAAIANVVERVKRSRTYRASADIIMLWGVVQIVQYAVLSVTPTAYAWTWIVVDGLGVVLTVFLLPRSGPSYRLSSARMFGTYLLFYAFGFLWSGEIGHFEGHAVAVFWHTLFLFGFCVAGLWFGLGFLVIGLGLSAAIVAIYLFAGPWFWPLLAVVSGGGYILCGFWMRRA